MPGPAVRPPVLPHHGRNSHVRLYYSLRRPRCPQARGRGLHRRPVRQRGASRTLRFEPPRAGTVRHQDPSTHRPGGAGSNDQLLGGGRCAAAPRGQSRGLQSADHQGHRPGQGQDRQGRRAGAGATPALRLPAAGLAARRGHPPPARADRPPQPWSASGRRCATASTACWPCG